MNHRRMLAVTAFAPIVWGTSYLTATELLPVERPLLTATLRALPAGLLLLAITRTLPRGAWWWRAAVLGVLNIGAFFAFMFVAATRLPGGVAATLGAVHPLIVTVLAAAVLGERVSRATRISLVVGAVGVAALVLTPEARLDTAGVVAGLAGAAASAVGVILTKRWGRPVGLVAFTGWQLVAGGVALLPVMLVIEGPPPALTATNLGGYAWLIGAGTVLAYLAWFQGILALPASRVSVLTFLTPLTAATLGLIVLGQTLAPLQLAGGAAILASVAVSARAAARPCTPETAAATPVGEPAREPEVEQTGVEQRHATVR